jgi:hypothetical protein
MRKKGWELETGSWGKGIGHKKHKEELADWEVSQSCAFCVSGFVHLVAGFRI